jgi:hypothetical protein
MRGDSRLHKEAIMSVIRLAQKLHCPDRRPEWPLTYTKHRLE